MNQQRGDRDLGQSSLLFAPGLGVSPTECELRGGGEAGPELRGCPGAAAVCVSRTADPTGVRGHRKGAGGTGDGVNATEGHSAVKRTAS